MTDSAQRPVVDSGQSNVGLAKGKLGLGDVLFQGSVGRSDIPGGDHATLIKSITDKLLPLGDDVGFICGHGPGSSIGQERLTNPFLTGAM